MQFAYGLSEVINQIPKLEHGTDGFIYTKVDAPYKAGTDDAMCVCLNHHLTALPPLGFTSDLPWRRLKWKPPHENSVDFKLELKFPELGDSGQPDFHVKPYFPLFVWEGSGRYRFFDMLSVGNDEWERYVPNPTLMPRATFSH